MLSSRPQRAGKRTTPGAQSLPQPWILDDQDLDPSYSPIKQDFHANEEDDDDDEISAPHISKRKRAGQREAFRKTRVDCQDNSPKVRVWASIPNATPKAQDMRPREAPPLARSGQKTIPDFFAPTENLKPRAFALGQGLKLSPEQAKIHTPEEAIAAKEEAKANRLVDTKEGKEGENQSSAILEAKLWFFMLQSTGTSAEKIRILKDKVPFERRLYVEWNYLNAKFPSFLLEKKKKKKKKKK
ncbi:hypothetical protein G6011_03173 [Alternaria panax]|uniref:Uncharacterized protein n=1 Tax=Alternaria panax TaxID=48097 RepID=A0AAD4IER8_9PLEO|nr:hypothetical protein G6011_03173 [Alternaria panax]